MPDDDNALIAKHMSPKYPPGHGREATGQPCWCSACKARSLLDLLIIVNDLKARGVSLLITQQSIDTRTAEGEMFLKQLGIFAEYETNLRRER